MVDHIQAAALCIALGGGAVILGIVAVIRGAQSFGSRTALLLGAITLGWGLGSLIFK